MEWGRLELERGPVSTSFSNDVTVFSRVADFCGGPASAFGAAATLRNSSSRLVVGLAIFGTVLRNSSTGGSAWCLGGLRLSSLLLPALPALELVESAAPFLEEFVFDALSSCEGLGECSFFFFGSILRNSPVELVAVMVSCDDVIDVVGFMFSRRACHCSAHSPGRARTICQWDTSSPVESIQSRFRDDPFGNGPVRKPPMKRSSPESHTETSRTLSFAISSTVTPSNTKLCLQDGFEDFSTVDVLLCDVSGRRVAVT
jgi:hypothetical protein